MNLWESVTLMISSILSVSSTFYLKLGKLANGQWAHWELLVIASTLHATTYKRNFSLITGDTGSEIKDLKKCNHATLK